MKPLACTLAAVFIVLCEPACAEMVPVAWDAAGKFSASVQVRPGQFVEACDQLPRGAQVSWSFDATATLDFNIHYHEGKAVRYPARKNQVRSDAGTLGAELAQDYCWMWTNTGAAATTLRFDLAKTPPRPAQKG